MNPDITTALKPNARPLPLRVQAMTRDLLNLSADFFDRRLQTILDSFQSDLAKESGAARMREGNVDRHLALHALQSNRHDMVPEFLSALQQRLDNIRNQAAVPATAAPLAAEMTLQSMEDAENSHLLADIANRCASQHQFELFMLGQRFGVLAAARGFEAERLPLGPKQLCACLNEASIRLELEPQLLQQVFFLFEFHIFGDFGQLLRSCNHYLIQQGILPNLTYIPFRSPDLRHKKSPIAKSRQGRKTEPAAAVAESDDGAAADSGGAEDNGAVSEQTADFGQLQQLLVRRRQLLNKLNSFSTAYLGLSEKLGDHARRASAKQIGEILNDLQQQTILRNNQGIPSVQHLKHDLMAQLRNLSTADQEYVLADADNDAIDMIGLLMDQALKEIPPESAASNLIGRLQAPLLQTVVQDKSFFSDHVHPARELLETMADAGFNWLDQPETDRTLHTQISDILSRRLSNFDGDSRYLKQVVDETRQLLDSMRIKAETVERRQIEASRGKERLKLAREHAEAAMDDLLQDSSLPAEQSDELKHAWVDVLALTELRSGADSQEWQQKKAIAVRLLALHAQPGESQSHGNLPGEIENALMQVGFHAQEAHQLAKQLLGKPDGSDRGPKPAYQRDRLGSGQLQAEAKPLVLNETQQAWLAEIETVPVGTWFEFILPGSSLPTRRKLAWRSLVLDAVLFVNQRGFKTAEMSLSELAIEVSEGRVRRESQNKRTIFQRAFKSVLSSLRSIMPTRQEPADE